MLFESWSSLLRLALFGSAAYLSAILMLRVSGSRTLSKMNAFDLVVTVAFGSTLSSILIDSTLSLATGVAALALLVLLQFGVAALAVRSARFRKLATTQPILLAWEGKPIDAAMRTERVTLDDMQAALRQRGLSDMDQVQAIVLEADGSLSVIERGADHGGGAALHSVAAPND